jgi:hypothetical protein
MRETFTPVGLKEQVACHRTLAEYLAVSSTVVRHPEVLLSGQSRRTLGIPQSFPAKTSANVLSMKVRKYAESAWIRQIMGRLARSTS